MFENLGVLRSRVRRLLPFSPRVFLRACAGGFFLDHWLTRRYFRESKSPKLHLGCGFNLLRDWLNTDFYPRSFKVRHMDATSRFPFPDNTFEKIYSEHMIEHLSYENGKKMIAECYRSLKPGGIIRVSTPDFAFLIGLYNNPTLPLHDRYIRWSSETYLHNRVPIKPIFTINNFVRDWGHLFIYDFETLCQTLASHGFVNIRKVEISKSDHTDLSGLENERRMPPGFLALESLIVEADKK